MAFEQTSYVGLDVGSTTAKVVVTDSTGTDVLFSRYCRHHTKQRATAAQLLHAAHAALPHATFRVAVCGSGAEPIAEHIGAFFVQEVTALAAAVGSIYPQVRTAIELGGQDAKVVSLSAGADRSAEPVAMRMNGVCAGGTGAFIDQIAALLDIPVERFDHAARKAGRVYEISGRCGVFAKTDIQPLLNAGAEKSDLALSCFHAIVRQTIGGLAHGLEMGPDVLFAGGPLTFNHQLVAAFQQRLGLSDDQVVRPDHPERFVALGAAIALRTMFADEPSTYDRRRLTQLDQERADVASDATRSQNGALFPDAATRSAFLARHRPVPIDHNLAVAAGTELWIGVDAGSTTCKFALLDRDGRVYHLFYDRNHGDPITTLLDGLRDLERRATQAGVTLAITGVGVTGYGAALFQSALHADHRSVETVAHAKAALAAAPQASAVIDIGGQDMKVIFLDQGVISDIVVNEACSAGCGSFLETYADTLSVPIERVAEQAFASHRPAKLGSRCTVFMNSSIITEQRNGKSTQDVLAGLCVSVVQNVFEKVLRPHSVAKLGAVIVAAGGTFANDAVLRAAERYLGRELVRPAHPKHMGAIGAALLAIEAARDSASGTAAVPAGRSLAELLDLSWQREAIEPCDRCANACARSVVRFSNGGFNVSGNRCFRGEEIAPPVPVSEAPAARRTAAVHRSPATANLVALRRRLLFAQQTVDRVRSRPQVTIGIPRVLDMWESAPFWNALFRSLGFRVVYSRPTTAPQYERGVSYVSSDTICLPAKVAHGHVEELLQRGVDFLFLPQMLHGRKDNRSAAGAYYCAILQGYSMVLRNMHDSQDRYNVPLLHPVLCWYTRRGRRRQLAAFLHDRLGVRRMRLRPALRQAERAQRAFTQQLHAAGNTVLQRLSTSDEFGVVIVGRPYHGDRFLNHDIPELFAHRGVPVLIPEALADLDTVDLARATTENEITFHNRVVATAELVAQHPALEMVQIVSFGCGHDAVLVDEAAAILKQRSGKVPLMLKVDDGSAAGPLQLRIDSFIATVRERRGGESARRSAAPVPHYLPSDRSARTIYAPNLSAAFSRCMAAVLGKRGIDVRTLPMADARAFELGKRYVHNDICFPAQVNIGEFLAAVERGSVDTSRAALGLAKNCESCRASQYPALARRALDAAGLTDVPIVTTGEDSKGWHPGFRLTLADRLGLLWGITITDELERIARRLRPYEQTPGSVDRQFEHSLQQVCAGLAVNYREALDALAGAIDAFNAVPVVTESPRKPRVGIVGEILLNYHRAANFDVERYLERHGIETVVPDMYLFFRKNALVDQIVAARGWSASPTDRLITAISGDVYDRVRARVRAVGRGFRLDEPIASIDDLARAAEPMVDLAYRGAEGWKLPGEIVTMAEHGVESFVIVQPFGCLPNHVTGRGFEKRIKRDLPGIHIVSLDFDPDTSAGNIENRLQMLIMNEKRKRLTTLAPG